MMKGITPEQEAALRVLGPLLTPGTYLAGGVAVALSFHHRESRDLDLFVPSDFDSERMAERLSTEASGVRITAVASGTLYLEIGGIPASLLSYRYPLLSEPRRDPGLPVPIASLDDLACMKLSAIASRGLARDFWDLHELLTHGAAGGTLREALELYPRKFSSSDVGHVIRSLAYFGDAEAAPLPRGLSPASWGKLRRDFERWVVELH